MEGESSTKFCLICGVEEEDSDKEGDSDSGPPTFSKDVKFGKFCGELELTSGGGGGSGGFTSFNFMRHLDKCSEFVRICEECSGSISDAVDKRGELEEKECQVLELQIKLLIKLKELEECSQVYLGDMGRIMEKVKGSELNGLGMNGFGEGKCDVLGFRETIINVVTSLGIFQDKLNLKLNPRKRGKESGAEQVEAAPAFMDDNLSEDFDKLSEYSPPVSPSNGLDDDIDKPTEPEQNLEHIKMETDNLVQLPEEGKPRLIQNKPDKPLKDKQYKKRKINKDNHSKIKWSEMGPLRSRFIKLILQNHKCTSDLQICREYKWSYDIPTDQVQFAGHPIQISEENNSAAEFQILTFQCLSCDDEGDGGGSFKTSYKFPIDNSKKITLTNYKIGLEIQHLKEKIFDHVLSPTHLDAFDCPKCEPGEFKKLGIKNLKRFRNHLLSHTDKKNRCHMCSTCGKTFYRMDMLKSHLESHKNKELREKVNCPFCGKNMLKRAYRNHKMFSCPVQAVRKEKMTCWVCGKGYKNEKSLGDHLVRTHRLAQRPTFK